MAGRPVAPPAAGRPARHAAHGNAKASLFRRVPRGVLALIALVSLAAVALAVVATLAFDVKPCPWCIFQRVLFLAIAAVALVGWATPVCVVTTVTATGVLLLALGGIASAVFQHEVAAQTASCALTMPDRFLNATGLEALAPWLFQVTATCADAAAARLLGLPYEVWSGLLFALVAVTAATLLRERLRRD